MSKFCVVPLGLNFRSQPIVRPSTRLATLPQGHVVTLIHEEMDGWWEVETSLWDRLLRGFVAGRFLMDFNAYTAENETTLEIGEHRMVDEDLPGVHLKENQPHIRRDRDGGRAFPIGEPNSPTRGQDPAFFTEELEAIVDWLKVDESLRYQPNSRHTFCNIYAYDYCYLARAYLPRVWWTDPALTQLRQGQEVHPRYDRTVREINANGLHNWLQDFGAAFQWERVFDLTELQEKVNEGQIGLICAQRINLNRSGHIAVVISESSGNTARRVGGRVTSPLQSQAGRVNRRRQTNIWWTSSQFREWGLWLHP